MHQAINQNEIHGFNKNIVKILFLAGAFIIFSALALVPVNAQPASNSSGGKGKYATAYINKVDIIRCIQVDRNPCERAGEWKPSKDKIVVRQVSGKGGVCNGLYLTTGKSADLGTKIRKVSCDVTEGRSYEVALSQEVPFEYNCYSSCKKAYSYISLSSAGAIGHLYDKQTPGKTFTLGSTSHLKQTENAGAPQG